MNWEEDLDFMCTKKVSASQGRRSGSSSSPKKPEEVSERLDNSPPEVLLYGRKTGKWADDSSKSGKRKNSTNIIELERFQSEKPESDDDDIPVIPDIEDFLDEDSPVEDQKLRSQGFKSTYREIDSELVKLETAQQFVNKSKIDLSLLTSKLIPEKDVKEDDEIWTVESLFEKIMSFVNN